jgi:hypothetical protein
MNKKTKFSHLDVMIDIETLSTEVNAAIVSISAKKFNPWSEEDGETCTIFVDVDDCKALGLHESESTLNWWKTNDVEVYNFNFNSQPRCSLKIALQKLCDFVHGCQRFWCQGMNFDAVILDHACKVAGVTPPWKFWQWRDARTIAKLCRITGRKNNHNPVADCENQIATIKEIFEVLKIQHC